LWNRLTRTGRDMRSQSLGQVRSLLSPRLSVHLVGTHLAGTRQIRVSHPNGDWVAGWVAGWGISIGSLEV